MGTPSKHVNKYGAPFRVPQPVYPSTGEDFIPFNDDELRSTNARRGQGQYMAISDTSDMSNITAVSYNYRQPERFRAAYYEGGHRRQQDYDNHHAGGGNGGRGGGNRGRGRGGYHGGGFYGAGEGNGAGGDRNVQNYQHNRGGGRQERARRGRGGQDTTYFSDTGRRAGVHYYGSSCRGGTVYFSNNARPQINYAKANKDNKDGKDKKDMSAYYHPSMIEDPWKALMERHNALSGYDDKDSEAVKTEMEKMPESGTSASLKKKDAEGKEYFI